MAPIRVLLADDHDLVRSGIRSLLAGIADIEVIGEAGNGLDAVRLARELKPDVVLIDVSMPDLNGLDATARIVRLEPKCEVIILSMHSGESYVMEALKAGASGYLLKNASVDELCRAIRMVARGERYLSPEVSKHVIDMALRGQLPGAAGGVQSSLALLAPRQREVLQMIAEGRTTREMAERLHLSEKTVEMYRAQIKERLDIYDTAGLTRYAVRVGLISVD
jgi:DNA-binding NarL/FixJ family response regulator